MIGVFINTLPVRVRLRPGEPLGDLLDRLQAEQAAPARPPAPRPVRPAAARPAPATCSTRSSWSRTTRSRRTRPVRRRRDRAPAPIDADRRRAEADDLVLVGGSASDATHYPLTPRRPMPGDRPAPDARAPARPVHPRRGRGAGRPPAPRARRRGRRPRAPGRPRSTCSTADERLALVRRHRGPPTRAVDDATIPALVRRARRPPRPTRRRWSFDGRPPDLRRARRPASTGWPATSSRRRRRARGRRRPACCPAPTASSRPCWPCRQAGAAYLPARPRPARRPARRGAGRRPPGRGGDHARRHAGAVDVPATAAVVVLDDPATDGGRRRPAARRRSPTPTGARPLTPRPPRLRHLHLGLDRPPQGRRRHPPQRA